LRLILAIFPLSPPHHEGIPFDTENDLRQRGTSKTPDTLLKVPVGIEVPKPGGGADETEWKMICWIDSKVRQSDNRNPNSNLIVWEYAFT
jgi:Protein of unknown function TPD sequence-motif